MIQRKSKVQEAEKLLEELDTISSIKDSKFKLWKEKTQSWLQYTFDEERGYFLTAFKQISWKPKFVIVGSPESLHQYAHAFKIGKQEAEATIRQAISELDSYEVDSSIFRGMVVASIERPRKIFISHGRSPVWLQIERFINRELRMETVELSEQANSGGTVIEKLERHSKECGFAVVVATGDDVIDEGTSRRARQNVIHEIGWFQAMYGRDGVCLIAEEGIDLPSNISGIVYIPFNGQDTSRIETPLRREILKVYES